MAPLKQLSTILSFFMQIYVGSPEQFCTVVYLSDVHLVFLSLQSSYPFMNRKELVLEEYFYRKLQQR